MLRVGMTIPLGNKYNDVSVICTCVGNRIFGIRPLERTGVCAMWSCTCSDAQANRINMDEHDGNKWLYFKTGSEKPDSLLLDNNGNQRREGKGVSEWNEEADVCSVTHLTSAEEYPDDEYLDMSKSSSLKQNRNKAHVSFLFVFIVFMLQEVD